MSKGDIVLVIDCGATNIRVIAINSKGLILASHSMANESFPDPIFPGNRIWDVNRIWQNLCIASQAVTARISKSDICGVTVTTFGVDGTFFDRHGKMLYPVISWQCNRTQETKNNFSVQLPESYLYDISGVWPFHFNTIYKLLWFATERPDIIEKAERFLFMPSVISHLLTGKMVNDMSMAGTSMLTSLKTRSLSDEILRKTGINPDLFGRLAEAGTITGNLTTESAALTSIPAGTPVVATGHDTQFAIFGSGAGYNQPVVSSGTWEILMARSKGSSTGPEQLERGLTTEFDAIPGLYNIGCQYLASGIIEWIRKNLFGDTRESVYEAMIKGASEVPPGSNGVKIVPSFDEDSSSIGRSLSAGVKQGASRNEIFRATLEALAFELSEKLKLLESAGQFTAESIICVGGGSKNMLWNQLKADATGVPIKLIDQKETTALGASLFVHLATGNANSAEEARSAINYNTRVVEPAHKK